MIPRHEAERRMSKRRNRNKWQEYEYRKKQIQMMGLSSVDYERMVRELTRELGI